MATGDDVLYQGILQAGQSIGQGIQQRSANRQNMLAQQNAMAMEQQKMALAKQKDALAQGQKLWEQLQQERNTFLTHAGNKAFPKSIRQQLYNNAAALDKQLNKGQGSFPPISEFDDQVGDVLDAFGVIDQDKNMSMDQKLGLKRQLIAQQAKQQGDIEQTKFLQGLMESTQKQDLGQVSTIGAVDTIIGKVDQALEQVGPFSAGLASWSKFIGGLPAADLDATLDTIKANLGFEELKRMKEASPTGGALGQVAVRELDFLQSSISSLAQKQSPKQLRRNLEEVGKHYMAWRDIVMQAKGEPSQTLPRPTTQSQAPSVPQTPSSQAPAGLPQVGQQFQGGKVLSIKKIK